MASLIAAKLKQFKVVNLTGKFTIVENEPIEQYDRYSNDFYYETTIQRIKTNIKIKWEMIRDKKLLREPSPF